MKKSEHDFKRAARGIVIGYLDEMFNEADKITDVSKYWPFIVKGLLKMAFDLEVFFITSKGQPPVFKEKKKKKVRK